MAVSPHTASRILRRAGVPHSADLEITDNAVVYRQSLRKVCASLGIRQDPIRPRCPWQNGKVERLNRALQTAWAYTPNAERAQPLRPGSSTTTLNDATKPSETDPRPAA